MIRKAAWTLGQLGALKELCSMRMLADRHFSYDNLVSACVFRIASEVKRPLCPSPYRDELNVKDLRSHMPDLSEVAQSPLDGQTPRTLS